MRSVLATGAELHQFLAELRQQFENLEIITDDGYSDISIGSKKLMIHEIDIVPPDGKVEISGHVALAPGRTSRVLQSVFKQWCQGRLEPLCDYLIVSKDDTVLETPPVIARAPNGIQALNKYLKMMHAQKEGFRSFVLETSGDLCFIERFYPATELEDETKDSKIVSESVMNGVRKFFSSAPQLGDRYIQFLQTGDTSFVTQDVYEFIALSLTEADHGLVALPVCGLKSL